VTTIAGVITMNVSQYKLLASAGVASIHMGYLGLWSGDSALGAAVFGTGALLTLYAVAGALWFSGPWKRARPVERSLPWRGRRRDIE